MIVVGTGRMRPFAFRTVPTNRSMREKRRKCDSCGSVRLRKKRPDRPHRVARLGFGAPRVAGERHRLEGTQVPLLGLALAALTGISLGLLGASGSVLTVPILVYVLGYTPKRAIPMARRHGSREAIVEAAERLFPERGFGSVSMRL